MSIVFCAMDSLLLQSRHGLEDNACCGMRCVRAPMDTGDQEKAPELSVEELPFHAMGQGWGGWADASSENQDGTLPPDDGEKALMTLTVSEVCDDGKMVAD